jgi:hypothetical protein
MNKKKTFKPVITKIALDPEQAVLACTCWGSRLALRTTGTTRRVTVCIRGTRTSTTQVGATTTTAARC